jgi:transcription elongation GreA/GreB family factor
MVTKREKLLNFSNLIKKESKKSYKRRLEARKSANEIAKVAAYSPSQSGDRTHAENQAAIYEENYKRLKSLVTFLEKKVKESVPEKVKIGCVVSVVYKDGTEEEIYLVNNPLTLPGFKVVSDKSLLGSALLDGKVGDVFKFLDREGRIVEIE